MATFNLTIDMDNAAFEDDGSELRDILSDVRRALFDHRSSGTVKDSNGNTVGRWEITV
jgi:hypothetical protein